MSTSIIFVKPAIRDEKKIKQKILMDEKCKNTQYLLFYYTKNNLFRVLNSDIFVFKEHWKTLYFLYIGLQFATN
jgi:hypothetical protein